MADNVLKAVVEAIAESDNEIGGTLITRLSEAHHHGREDGAVSIGGDVLTSPADAFESAMIGLELDIVAKSPLTGNEGRYKIAATPTPATAQLTTLAGGVVAFAATENPVIWRIGTLRVETVFEFLSPPGVTDLVGKLWVGDEPDPVSYGAVTVAPGANTFDQLGDPLTGSGYLTTAQPEDAEVIEARRGYSALDRLWRAMLTEYAEGDELDRIGRVLNVPRPRGIGDAIYRRLLQVVPYLPRCIVWAFELVLQALYPAKTPAQVRAMIYEDLANFPCAIFLDLPDVAPGAIYEGRCFFNEQEDLTSSSATSITITRTPITIESAVTRPVQQSLGMAVLPSADSPAWTYVNEGLVEGASFSIVPKGLQHLCTGTANGGRYTRATALIDKDFCEASVWWQADLLTTVGGYPWHMYFRDGEREYVLQWSDSRIVLGQLDGTVLAFVNMTLGTIGQWYNFRIKRRGVYVYVSVDGQDIFGPVAAQAFGASVLREVGFGYKNNGSANSWRVFWDNLSFSAASKRNYYNLRRADGSLTTGSVRLTSAAALFVSGDTGKRVRLFGAKNKNNGLWLATYVSATELDLGTVFGVEASVSGSGTAALVELLDPLLRPVDVGKTITIAGSGSGNNGNVVVLEWIDQRTVRVNKPAGFVPEQHLQWGFAPVFETESSVLWEIVRAGSNAGSVLTLRDSLPAALCDVKVVYTSVLSAQLLRDEFVRNDGSGGAPPNVFYPAYFLDVGQSIRNLLSDITAAGVIPLYQRPT